MEPQRAGGGALPRFFTSNTGNNLIRLGASSPPLDCDCRTSPRRTADHIDPAGECNLWLAENTANA